MISSWDDERLFSALKSSHRARQSVPPGFIEIAKSAYAWHNIDSDLAQLTYDSVLDHSRELIMRSETASVRALTFTSAHLTLELEVSEDSLLGQAIPASEGTVDIHTRDGAIATVPVDMLGTFAIRPIPASPFRLRCSTTVGTDVLTGWITL